jgi:hypothetical protein
MRTIRRRLAIVLGTVAAPTLILAPAAGADSGPLPLPGFGGIAVDQGHKHVFVTGGPAANTVVVTNFSGNVIKKIDGEFGAAGLAFGSDSKTLYVALAAGDAIAAIDTDTLAETARYTTQPQTCPTSLARTGQYLWFGYGCAGTVNGGVGRVDTAATPPTVLPNQQGTATFQGAPLVTSATAEAGPVVAAQPTLSLSSTTVYAVTNGALQAGASGAAAGSNLVDETVSPDGSTLFTAAGSQNAVSGFATADLSGRGAYATGHYPNAIAVSADGQYLAAGAFTTSHKAFVYRIGGTTPIRSVDLGNRTTADRGLAWSADGKSLFLITQRTNDLTPSLSILRNPTQD